MKDTQIDTLDLKVGRLLRDYRNALYEAFEIVQELQKHGYERPWLDAAVDSTSPFSSSTNIVDIFKVDGKAEPKMVKVRIRLEIR